MSRLSFLALALLSLPAASSHAAIFFEPSPVPSQCQPGLSLAPYYQLQLQALNRPFSINPQPTVDLFQRPCASAPLYYRKADLMPHVTTRVLTAPAPMEKGTIYIIPKNFLDRPVKSFTPPSNT
ncbi:MAG TPA: hypothetical protein VFE58_05885 [Tepidisphaeraceae bacterium]|jgi:hypothetical protein|nr:hypothetical protein [Tepidisphaeraceae bacterium]